MMRNMDETVTAASSSTVDEEAVKRAARAMSQSRLLWGTHADRWTDSEWQDEFWTEAARVALDAAKESGDH